MRDQAACSAGNDPDMALRSDQRGNVRVSCGMAKQELDLGMTSGRKGAHDLRNVLLRVLHADNDRQLDSGIHSKHVPELPKGAPQRDIGKGRPRSQIAE